MTDHKRKNKTNLEFWIEIAGYVTSKLLVKKA